MNAPDWPGRNTVRLATAWRRSHATARMPSMITTLEVQKRTARPFIDAVS
jgi:hypothetical protein